MGVENEPLAHRSVSKVKQAALFAAPVALLTIAYGAGTFGYTRYLVETPVAVVEVEPDGASIYAQQCAYCHGPRGDGKGTSVLNPPARNFGSDKFKLGTTLNGVPSDNDLLRVLKRGIPGSAMPKFDHLTETEANAVVAHVRTLARNGMMAAMAAKAVKNEDDPDHGDYYRKTAALATPGVSLPAITFGSPTKESLDNGKAAFVKVCATCHGAEGRGDGPQVAQLKNEDGTPARPRDLTQGVFKGGREKEQLYARIVLGIPGTPMPASSAALSQKDVLDLVNFVLSMSPEPASPAAPAPTPGSGT